ncbi:zinc-binding dehydrogenase [Brevibacterium linens]|uniref:S-(Hydroxymethyl)glutathione dehydrogenase / alcohol dehydrogenase n=2 Tax=Brevibacterium linens TaxID=1703 RepID=A0A2H1JQV9_BRELN|nr:Zn-dependent alcohol dehydrogenase [Brevibacterium linens]KAB1950084.1 Zn-dependent alcohol dehydrogenase [Brevibacterium linens ATCC 9172]SMX89886.1 S-(hydroxymethyl)glutathione dehydrogenase / alcohol dehydrogenase [Brevibacterium linens]SMX99015.1 S-(hydroxymethyl)glutathione dehydrogenase / alcohol dehydrogenase [Brevibacterium linens ATCC 9172]
MKASLATAIGEKFSLHDVVIDDPVGREVLVDVKASGLCHSDLHLIDHDFGMPLPAVGGHEISGVVKSVGPGVTSMSVGDRVVACLITYCGACAECLSGRTTLCSNPSAVARKEGEKPRVSFSDGTEIAQSVSVGGFAEQVLVHENQLAVVNDEIPFPQAALLGCSVVTGAGAAINTAHVRPGETVAVIGTGGIGLNAISGARLCGAKNVIAIDILDSKLEAAKKFGATDVINSASTDPVEAVQELTGGVDHAFEAIGLDVTQRQVQDMTRPGGTAYLIGIAPPGSTTPFDSSLGDLFAQKRLHAVLMGSSNVKRDIALYADLYVQGRFELDHLVTQEISINEINEGYEQLLKGEVIRSVITSF